MSICPDDLAWWINLVWKKRNTLYLLYSTHCSQSCLLLDVLLDVQNKTTDCHNQFPVFWVVFLCSSWTPTIEMLFITKDKDKYYGRLIYKGKEWCTAWRMEQLSLKMEVWSIIWTIYPLRRTVRCEWQFLKNLVSGPWLKLGFFPVKLLFPWSRMTFQLLCYLQFIIIKSLLFPHLFI